MSATNQCHANQMLNLVNMYILVPMHDSRLSSNLNPGFALSVDK